MSRASSFGQTSRSQVGYVSQRVWLNVSINVRVPGFGPLSSLALGTLMAGLMAAGLTNSARADDGEPGDQVQLEQKVDILAEELASLREKLVIPETKALEGHHGFGPGASKVYTTPAGISLGGYGEVYYSNLVKDKEEGAAYDSSDLYRFVLYTGYKFSDRILLNAELEWEHAGSETGSLGIEFAYLDFSWRRAINVRAGTLLIPMGFVNEMHEPPFFRGNFRPETERQILPSTWRENGVGLYGELLPGLEYKAYLVNGMDARGFSDRGIRGGRQSAGKVLAEDFATVVRLDYNPVNTVLAGGSFYYGKSGQGQTFEVLQLDNTGAQINDGDGNPVYDSVIPDVATMMYEGHLQLRFRGFEFKGLYSGGSIGDADVLSAASGSTVPDRFGGYYVELSGDVLSMVRPGAERGVVPWVRYEAYNTQKRVPEGLEPNLSRDLRILYIGVEYKPHPNVVIKLDYRDMQSQAEGAMEADSVNVGMGYVF